MSAPQAVVTYPDEGRAERGTIRRCGVTLSQAEHWVEDGIHVIRSTEFECYAEDDDFEGALRRFGETLEDLAHHLAALVKDGRATDEELQRFSRLASRLIEISEREKPSASERALRALRRRRGCGATWDRSQQTISSRLSHA